MRIHFNAPFSISFSALCVAITILALMGGETGIRFFALNGTSVSAWWTFLSYPFVHAGWEHLLGNLGFILLLGPALEEKYGSYWLMGYTFFTVIVTAVFHQLLFTEGLVGASGVVFQFIIMSSLTHPKKNSLPLSFVLVFVLFIGKELIQSVQQDQVSQFGHIIGGILGGILGLFHQKRKSILPE